VKKARRDGGSAQRAVRGGAILIATRLLTQVLTGRSRCWCGCCCLTTWRITLGLIFLGIADLLAEARSACARAHDPYRRDEQLAGKCLGRSAGSSVFFLGSSGLAPRRLGQQVGDAEEDQAPG